MRIASIIWSLKAVFNLNHNLAHFHAERLTDFIERLKGRLAHAALNRAEVSSADRGQTAEYLLRHLVAAAEIGDDLADNYGI